MQSLYNGSAVRGRRPVYSRRESCDEVVDVNYVGAPRSDGLGHDLALAPRPDTLRRRLKPTSGFQTFVGDFPSSDFVTFALQQIGFLFEYSIFAATHRVTVVTY
jgi:hypothetical protein